MDIRSFTRELESRVSDLRDVGMRVFSQNTFAHIPVWSGASAASILPLASLVGLPLSVSPIAFAPQDYPFGDPYHGTSKGMDLQESEKIDYYGFSYTTKVPQFVMFEDSWKAIQRGDRALEQYSRLHFKNVVPNWALHISVSII